MSHLDVATSMTPPNEVEIFNAALELGDPEGRDRYLDSVCGGQAALHQRIADLLAAYSRGSDRLNRLSPAGRGRGGGPAAPPAPFVRMGPYLLQRQIGEGGWGVVWEAMQEVPIRRQVALKVVRPGLDSRGVLARFDAERAALARMDHPNIARLFDAGTTDAGQPYFVMELVRGDPINRGGTLDDLSLEEKLRLFIQVCQAVQHAHQKGVLHRDLKPSNVLVTRVDGQPQPKVIDFGIAKAIGSERLHDATAFTTQGMFLGTPAYMSPEQAAPTSNDVDTRSDLHSLGVLLYELLTGTQPFPEDRLKRASYAELQQIFWHEEPERPSTRLARELALPGELRTAVQALRGDLDWIVLKCLEKDRDRRYATVNGLAVDLERFLAHEPVVARPPTVTYRVRKLIRRRRAASVAVALVTVVTLAATAVSTRALIREREARAQADRRLQSALRFAGTIFDKVAPKIRRLPGAVEARKDLGEASFEMLDSLRADAAADPAVRDALVQAHLYLSQTQGNVAEGNSAGNPEAGLQHARQALELLMAKPLDQLSGSELQSLIRAQHLVAASLRNLGRYDEACHALDATYPWIDRLEGFPDFAAWARTRRMAHRGDAGYFASLAGHPREGLDRYLLPVVSSDWARNITTNSPEWELEVLANTYGQITAAHLLLEEFEFMTTAAEEGIVYQQALVHRFPGNVRHAGCLAGFQSVLGHGLMHRGRPDEAKEALREARQTVEDLVRQDPANEFARVCRRSVAFSEARAWAVWSRQPSASVEERRERLARAELHLVEAERFGGELNSGTQTVILEPARADIAEARASLAEIEPTR